MINVQNGTLICVTIKTVVRHTIFIFFWGKVYYVILNLVMKKKINKRNVILFFIIEGASL